MLDVNKTANLSEIKKAYRNKVMQYHPDKNNSADAGEKFIELTEAYEVLTDSSKRAIFDSLISSNIESKEQMTAHFKEWEDYGKKKANEYHKCANCGKEADIGSHKDVSLYKVTGKEDKHFYKNIMYKTITINVPYCKECSSKLDASSKISSPILSIFYLITYLISLYIVFDFFDENNIFIIILSIILGTLIFLYLISFSAALTPSFVIGFSFYYFTNHHWLYSVGVGALSFAAIFLIIDLAERIFLSKEYRVKIEFPSDSKLIKSYLNNGWKIGNGPKSKYETPT